MKSLSNVIQRRRSGISVCIVRLSPARDERINAARKIDTEGVKVGRQIVVMV